MTCIAAFVEEGRVWMGGDSAGVSGEGEITPRADEKVFFNGEYLVGFAGSFRLGQVLRYVFEPPPVPEGCYDIERFMVRDFVDTLRECLKRAGVAQKDDGAEAASIGSGFLVAYRENLWRCDHDYQLGRSRAGMFAIGLGYQLALGSMYALNHSGVSAFSPKERIERALFITERFSGAVRAPFTILHT